MNKTRVIVDDHDLDLFPDTVVATTIKGIDVGDLTSRFASHTNSFKIPLTKGNIKAYEHANVKNSQTNVPYTGRDAKVIQNGTEVIQFGTEVITKIGDSIELSIFAKVYDFASKIANKMLYDLELNLNDSWTDATIKDYRNATTGLVAPVMDYGNYDATTDDLDVSTYLPSVYYHTIIEGIIEGAGYAYSGDVFANDKYLKLIQPYGRDVWGYAGKFVETFNFIAEKTGNQGQTTTPTKVDITVETKESIYYDSTNSRFTQSKTSYTGKFNFYLKVKAYADDSGSGGGSGSGALFIGIYKNGTVISGAGNTISGTGTTEFVLTTINAFPNGISLNSGDYIEVIAYETQVGAVGIVNEGTMLWCEALTEPDTANIQPDKLLPEISQSDYIKDFLVRFGLQMNEVAGTIYFKSIDEIITDTGNSVDLTSKRVRSLGLKFTPDKYANINKFTYQKPSDVDNVLTGQGSFTLPFLKNEKTIFSTFFNSCKTEYRAEILMAVIPVYDTSTDRNTFDAEPQVRLLLVRDKYSYEPSVTYDTAQASYKVAYFDDPGQSNSCSFQDVIDQIYTLLVNALQKTKVETIEYMLNEIDIRRMNPHTLIFDTDAYYIINTIGPFVPGVKTKAELFKVS